MFRQWKHIYVSTASRARQHVPSMIIQVYFWNCDRQVSPSLHDSLFQDTGLGPCRGIKVKRSLCAWEGALYVQHFTRFFVWRIYIGSSSDAPCQLLVTVIHFTFLLFTHLHEWALRNKTNNTVPYDDVILRYSCSLICMNELFEITQTVACRMMKSFYVTTVHSSAWMSSSK